MRTQQQILTGADQLLRLIQEHNVVSVKKAARILERDSDMIMLLSESLEEHGSIVVHHTLGDALLVDKEHYEATSGSVRLIKPALRSILSLGFGSRPRSSTQERERALDERRKTIDKRARLLEERHKALEKHADSLGVLERRITCREEHIRKQSSDLERRERELTEREQKAARQASNLENRERTIRAMLDKARRLF